MARPLRTRSLHTWLGIGFGAPLALLVVTGILLHFEEYLKPVPVVVAEADRAVAPVPIERLIALAEERLGGRPLFVELSNDPAEPVMLQRGLDQVFFSPGGRFIAKRSEKSSWRFIVMALHSGGAGRRLGEWLALFVGIALLGSLITGVGIWPRFIRWRRSRPSKS